MEIIALLVVIGAVYFFFIKKSKPKDCSVNTPIVVVTPLRTEFHVVGLINNKQEYMPAFVLLTPLLNFNLRAAVPELKQISEEDEMITYISHSYFMFLMEYANRKNLQQSTTDYIVKTSEFFYMTVARYLKEHPHDINDMFNNKLYDNGLDGIIYSANEYLEKRTNLPVDIRRDIAPSIELWLEKWVFNALEYMEKFDKHSKYIVDRM